MVLRDGVTSIQGNPINNDHYETVQACFSGGRAWVGKASEEGLLRYFCIDSEGNEISPFGWNYARPFQNGIAIVGTNQISLSNGSFFDDCYQLSYGFIDYMGNVVCEPKWDYLSDFSSTGIAICGKYNSNNEMRFGYINSNGIEMTAIEWKTADAFSESYAIVSTEQNVWKILDEHFNCVQSLDDISNMGAVHSGLIAASFIDRKNQSLNNVYININGEVVIRPDAEMICPFVDGFACICKKGYKYKSEIVGDNALFSETGLCGAINTEGVSVITPEWDMIANCGSGVFIVEKDAEYWIINAMLQKASSQSFKMIYSSIINGKLLGITADDRFVSIDPETFVLRDTIISDNERKVIGDNTIYSDY